MKDEMTGGGAIMTLTLFNFIIFMAVSAVIIEIESKIRENLKKQGLDYPNT